MTLEGGKSMGKVVDFLFDRIDKIAERYEQDGVEGIVWSESVIVTLQIAISYLILAFMDHKFMSKGCNGMVVATFLFAVFCFIFIEIVQLAIAINRVEKLRGVQVYLDMRAEEADGSRGDKDEKRDK